MKNFNVTSRKTLEQKINVRLLKLAQCGPSIAGSLGQIRRRCGRTNCQCAHDDSKKHPALLLTSKVKGKTKAVYVPADMQEEVERWVGERRQIKRLLKEIDQLVEQIIRQHVRASRAANANGARFRSAPPASSPAS